MQLLRNNPKKRLLVCAPSNEALRNLLLAVDRIKNPSTYMAFVGVEKEIPAELNEIYVSGFGKKLYQSLIAAKKQLKDALTSELITSSIDTVRLALQAVYDKVNELSQCALPCLLESEKYPDRFQDLAFELLEIMNHDISDKIETLTSIERAIQLIREKKFWIEEFLVQRAQVVFATLVASGRPWLNKQVSRFDVVLLDEAVQALIPEALIPLKFSPSLYIQIGDPMQLPAVVKSKQARDNHYDNSMMDWLTRKHNQCYEMLTVQYRMHPSICQLISSHVDDILLSSPTQKDRQWFVKEMNKHLELVSHYDDNLSYLGIKINYDRAKRTIRCTQEGYIRDLVKKYNLTNLTLFPATPHTNNLFAKPEKSE